MALALHVPRSSGEAYRVGTTMVMAAGLQDRRKEGLKSSLFTFHIQGYKSGRMSPTRFYKLILVSAQNRKVKIQIHPTPLASKVPIHCLNRKTCPTVGKKT